MRPGIGLGPDRRAAAAFRAPLERKAILRAAGFIPLHDEDAAFAEETSALKELGDGKERRIDRVAALSAFKAVVLEGLEVVFVVLAVGAGRGMLTSAAVGAAAACLAVLLLGAAIHQPLARVPENTLKFVVGVLLSAFGVFWTGEGLGVAWPGADLAIVAFALVFLAVGYAGIIPARSFRTEAVA